jgi:putative Mg2+ transporter-C (MgtC) family protein
MDWLTGNWYLLLPAPLAHLALAAVALACAFIIGVERFRKEKPVGVRTLGLVSFGAAVFVMIGCAVSPDGRAEAARVIGQIASGVGFLGAGVILRGQYGVTGLTSAATIWAVAAVGCVAGAGHGGGAIGASALMWLLLTITSRLEGRFQQAQKSATAVIRFQTNGGRTALRIEEVLDDFHIPPRDQNWSCSLDHEVGVVTVKYHHLQRHHRECLVRIAEVPDVISVERDEERMLDRY